jgi:hypothetical protein
MRALPPKSRGIYEILGPDLQHKYIGSAIDINKRLSMHHKNGILESGDFVKATIFENSTRQREILAFEKSSIKKLRPKYNKHPGAPGRPWRSEQISKLQAFYEFNKDLLTPQGQVDFCNLLSGKASSENYKLARGLFKAMKLFR